MTRVANAAFFNFRTELPIYTQKIVNDLNQFVSEREVILISDFREKFIENFQLACYS